jgi:hypothetical protein
LGWLEKEKERGRLETSWHGYMVFSLDGGFWIGTCRGFASLISLVMGWRRKWGFNWADCRVIGIFLLALLLAYKRVFSVARFAKCGGRGCSSYMAIFAFSPRL